MFGTQRVLRASGTRLAPTEPEGETASSNLVASIPWQGRRKHWINSVSGSFFVFETGFERCSGRRGCCVPVARV